MSLTIETIGADGWDEIVPLIQKLLDELGEEGDDLDALDAPAVKQAWQKSNGAVALVARDEQGAVVGAITVVESFAIHANGCYGIVNEVYVMPGQRSKGVGASLIEAATKLGESRGWRRLDVTAPESERWSRTREFYERHGFVYTGPKFKLKLG